MLSSILFIFVDGTEMLACMFCEEMMCWMDDERMCDDACDAPAVHERCFLILIYLNTHSMPLDMKQGWFVFSGLMDVQCFHFSGSGYITFGGMR